VLTATDPTGGSAAWTATQVDGESDIEGVSCSLPTLCVAVDDHGNILISTNPTGGASAWTVSHVSPEPLYQVACAGSELCFAAGDSPSPSFVSTDPTGGPSSWTLTEGVDGTGGVSCPSSTLCVAADDGTNAGLSESADPAAGTSSWYQGEPGNVGHRFVKGLSCASSSLCLAASEGDVFLSAPADRLSVSLLGTGSGGVRSTPGSCPFESCSHPGPQGEEPAVPTSIMCSDANDFLLPNIDCAFGFPVGSEVTLTATPASGSAFTGWSGPCTGEGTCSLGMSGEMTVDATFSPIQPPPSKPSSTGPYPIASISSLHESRSVFAVARPSTPLTGHTAKHRPFGTVFSFTLSRAATVKLAITTSRPGRRSGKSCKPESHALQRKQRCTRTVTVATLIRAAVAGANSIAFTGRIGHKALRPGRYRAIVTATDQAGTSAARSIGFTVVPG
jgi:hypothetical protein